MVPALIIFLCTITIATIIFILEVKKEEVEECEYIIKSHGIEIYRTRNRWEAYDILEEEKTKMKQDKTYKEKISVEVRRL